MPEAQDPPEQFDFSGSEWISLPAAELDSPLRGAILVCLPEGATYSCTVEDDLGWVIVSQPGDTRKVLHAARGLLGRR